MNTEQQARSRHLAAFLEEAHGTGASPDLAARVVSRLADEPRRLGRPLLAAVLVLAGIGVVVATAYLQPGGDGRDTARPATVQDPVRAAETLTVRVRRPAEGEIEWLVGERRAATAEELAAALHAALAAGTKRKVDTELVIAPEPGTEWRHVAATTDAGHAAGFLAIRYAEVGTPRLVPKQVAAANEGEGRALAEVKFREPDEDAAPGRPTLELAADGRILHEGEVLFQPTRKDGDRGDTAKLRARLAELRTKLLPAGERELAPGGRKVLKTPLLLRAHRGVEWHFVQLVLRLATDPAVGFDEVQFAVAGARGAGDPVHAEKK